MSRSTIINSISVSPRRATNVTLPEALLSESRALGISLSQAYDRGLAAEVAETHRHPWVEENCGAVEAWNEHIAAKRLPLPAYRSL